MLAVLAGTSGLEPPLALSCSASPPRSTSHKAASAYHPPSHIFDSASYWLYLSCPLRSVGCEADGDATPQKWALKRCALKSILPPSSFICITKYVFLPAGVLWMARLRILKLNAFFPICVIRHLQQIYGNIQVPELFLKHLCPALLQSARNFCTDFCRGTHRLGLLLHRVHLY